MIHIPYKLGENTISIPRNTDYSGNFTLRITSELTYKNYDYDVTDEGNSKRYYKFTIDTTDIEDAEYRYFLIQDDKKIADGIIQIGDLTDSIPEFLFYDAFKDRENLQYYPIKRDYVVVRTEKTIPWDATEITFQVKASLPWSTTLYIGATGIATITGETGTHTESFSISANTSSEPRVFELAYGDIEGDLDAKEVYITQEAAEPTDYSKKRFTIEMLEDGNINWEGRGYEYYDIIRNGIRDEGNQLDHSVDGLLAGDIVEFYLRTDNTNLITTHITSTAKHNVYGNIMSLLYVDFEDVVTIPNTFQFAGLFKYDTGLVNAENLILPATTLKDSCYRELFLRCSNLIKAPTTLPATTLADACYFQMLEGCTSLVEAPVLPATTLAKSCYANMLSGCSSLTEAPKLPATTLARACYYAMLEGCTSLTTAPELPATTLADYCYYKMLSGCRVLANAPALPATTLAAGCYQMMLQNCSNLNYIKCLATDISAANCTTNWTNGVAKVGTFVKPFEMKDWTYGNNGIPSTWLVMTE